MEENNCQTDKLRLRQSKTCLLNDTTLAGSKTTRERLLVFLRLKNSTGARFISAIYSS